MGRTKAEDALKLTAFGISANDFLRLQEFLPMVSSFPGRFDEQSQLVPSHIEGVLWKQSEFGHPGNWRAEVVDFCINPYLNVALSIQNAASVPHAVDLSDLYEYKVTAKRDQVEVWEDFVEDPLIHVDADNGRPFRIQKRLLKKGEAVAVSVHAQPFISDDVSLSGERIQRVRLSYDHMESMFASRQLRAQYVNRADVDITCAPETWIKELRPDLPEVPWEEDPLAFSL